LFFRSHASVEAQDLTQAFAPLARTLSRLTGAGVLVLSPDGDVVAAEAGPTLSGVWATLRDRLPGPVAALAADGYRTEVPANGRALQLELLPLADDWTVALLRESDDAVEQEDRRLASRTRAIAAVYRPFVHDLKAPLNAAVISLELLRAQIDRALDDGEERKRLLGCADVIRRELGRLTDGLRTLAAETGPPRDEHGRFDLAAAVRELVALVDPAARSQRVHVACEVPDAPILVEARKDRIKLALLNLLVNALEATPVGGAIGVTVTLDGAHARIDVTDHGPGIAATSLEHVFEPRVTTKPGAGGMGLPVSRTILADAGGGIVLTPVPGGLCATATLPVAGPRE
jgi:signal transduction histidine kinase